METLFLAILSICVATTNCSKAEDFTQYISEPFAIAASEDGWLPLCVQQLEKLKASLPEEHKDHAMSTLCTSKSVWDENHPDSYSE